MSVDLGTMSRAIALRSCSCDGKIRFVQGFYVDSSDIFAHAGNNQTKSLAFQTQTESALSWMKFLAAVPREHGIEEQGRLILQTEMWVN